MSYVSLLSLAECALEGGFAIPSFCTWNAESMDAVLNTAMSLEAPVILMQGPDEFPVLCPSAMAKTARALKSLYDIPAALHLDHGNSMEMVSECVAADYTSVMLDYSTYTIEENIKAMQAVVTLARPRGITVEGEVGLIGKADDTTVEGSEASAYTDPEIAVDFVDATGIDLLAVSIGNKHGFYRGDPLLRFDLLKELRDSLSVPLVLHGGTGIPEADIRKAIDLGIVKINVASELIHGFRRSLSDQWERGENNWTPLAVTQAKKELERIVEKWIRICGAAGMAGKCTVPEG